MAQNTEIDHRLFYAYYTFFNDNLSYFYSDRESGDEYEDDLVEAINNSMDDTKLLKENIIPDFKVVMFQNVECKECSMCSICQDDFSGDELVSVLDCNHVYHIQCIRTWSVVKLECPICRNPII